MTRRARAHRGAHAARSHGLGQLALYAQGACRLPRPVGSSAPRHRHGHRPRHSTRSRLRVSPLFACLGALSLVVGGAALGSLRAGGALADTVINPGNGGGSVSIMNGMAKAFASSPGAAALRPATAPPAPAPPSLEGSPALRPHEMFGYAPYWTLPISSGFNLAGLTTLAYFSVGVGGDATVQESGPGWVGYQSQALADLVTRAHDAGDRVVLTASCFGQAALDKMAADPTAGARLGASLVQLVAAKNLDGVSLDFEGKGSKDQAGLDTLVAAVSAAMHEANPHWQVTMATYASSAGDPAGFYDIRGLSASVDGFFVMAYDMNNRLTPSPTAPLTGAGFTDLDAVQQYTAVVSPSKVILGVPYYGYDWPTAGPGLGDPATGPPTPLSYAQIAATGGRVYWDPTTQTAWTSYQVGSQWHQTFFDNPTSLGMKAQLADSYHIAGLGIWALGMEGNASAMQSALQGNAPIVKGPPPGPLGGATTTTTTVPPTYAYAGTWNGVAITLSPVAPGSLAGASYIAMSTQLAGFATNDPTRLCLEAEPGLPVTSLAGSPGVFIVTAATPDDCSSGTWEFTVAPGQPGDAPTTTTTTPPDPTSTTTPPDPTSTTTPPDPTSTTSTTSP